MTLSVVPHATVGIVDLKDQFKFCDVSKTILAPKIIYEKLNKCKGKWICSARLNKEGFFLVDVIGYSLSFI